MPTKDFIFISYSRQDKAFVDRLGGDLRNAGVRVWRDVEEIAPGANWEQEIKNSLLNAAVLLFVSSEHSSSSAWMEHELRFFLDRGGPVLPLVIDDGGAARLPRPLTDIQWVDFRQDYDTALKRLLSALPPSVRQVSPVEPKEAKAKGYVFLNYAEEDSNFVEIVREFLSQRGYAYWDYQESDRDYHADLDLELEGIIQEAAATLSIISPHWKASRWARKEYFFSEEVRTPVFLLRAVDPGPTLAIAGAHFIDFTGDPKTGFAKLTRELDRKGL